MTAATAVLHIAPETAQIATPAKKAGAKKKRGLRRKPHDESLAMLVRVANHLILKDRMAYQDAMALFQAAVVDVSLRANEGCRTRAAKDLRITREHMSKISDRAKLIK